MGSKFNIEIDTSNLNNILDDSEAKMVKNKIDHRLILGLGLFVTLLISFLLIKFRGVIVSKSDDSDFLNIYDIFCVVLVINIIIATLAIANFYYRIRITGRKGQRGVRGLRGEQGENAKCNVYLPRLIKFKKEDRPGKIVENVVDPSRNTVSMDIKNKKYGIHYGWFPVEIKDVDNKTNCRDIKDEKACNQNTNCRYRNDKCFKRKKNEPMNVFLGESGCQVGRDPRCYDTKSINLPYNKPINGMITNNQTIDGDITALQFTYDDNKIPTEDNDQTKPLVLNDICKTTGKMWSRGQYSRKPNTLDSSKYCQISEKPNICSEKTTQNSCLDLKCDWVECEEIVDEADCTGRCSWNSMRRKCTSNNVNAGKCKDLYTSKCKSLKTKSDCVKTGCYWNKEDNVCHDTYLGVRKQGDNYSNFDFKCPPNSAIYKIETLSSNNRKFGGNDLKPGVLKGIKFHCRDITTGKHTKIYDKNNFLNDYIVIGQEPKPDSKKYKYDTIQCNIHVDEKNRNYPGFISNISALHGDDGISGIGVNLCSYFKDLKK